MTSGNTYHEVIARRVADLDRTDSAAGIATELVDLTRGRSWDWSSDRRGIQSSGLFAGQDDGVGEHDGVAADREESCELGDTHDDGRQDADCGKCGGCWLGKKSWTIECCVA